MEPEQGAPWIDLIEKLTAAHDLSTFQSGKALLDDWLRRFALINQQSDTARTFVLLHQNKVCGYYSLAAGSVARDETPARIAKGLAKHPVSVILLARLAVDRAHQGKGIGRSLLADALVRSVAASQTIGARAILVHAIDEEAASFYRKFGFEESPLNEKQLFLLMKDVRASLRKSGRHE